MKVYGVCVECTDSYYGYNPPRKIFSSKEKAEKYVKENFEYNEEDDSYYEILVFATKVEIFDWEVE